LIRQVYIRKIKQVITIMLNFFLLINYFVNYLSNIDLPSVFLLDTIHISYSIPFIPFKMEPGFKERFNIWLKMNIDFKVKYSENSSLVLDLKNRKPDISHEEIVLFINYLRYSEAVTVADIKTRELRVGFIREFYLDCKIEIPKNLLIELRRHKRHLILLNETLKEIKHIKSMDDNLKD
jgi:hypothetical protein